MKRVALLSVLGGVALFGATFAFELLTQGPTIQLAVYGQYRNRSAEKVLPLLTARLFADAKEYIRQDALEQQIARYDSEHEEQLAATVQSLKPLKANTPAAMAKLVQTAEQRKAAMKKLAADNPEAFLLNAIPESILKQLPANVRPHVEKKTTLTGTYNVLISENPQTGLYREEYEVFVGEGRNVQKKKLQFAASTTVHALKSGSKIAVQGVSIDDIIVVQDADPLTATEAQRGDLGISLLQEAAPAQLVSSRRLIGVIINFQDVVNPLTQAEMMGVLVSNSNSVANYYKEVSFGTMNFTAVTVDPVTVTTVSTNVACGEPGRWGQEVMAELTKRGFSINGANDILVIRPPINGLCGYGGQAGGIWGSGFGLIQTAFLYQHHIMLYDHEVGHTIGMSHASVLSPFDEYGDKTDVMGNPGGPTPHINSAHKLQMGWIPESRILTVTQSGVYNISPLAAPTSEYPIALRIKRTNQDSPSTGNPYPDVYVSYRRPIGFDSQLATAYSNKTSVHTHSGNTFIRAVLGNNQTFADPVNPIKVTQLSQTDTSASVDVQIGELLPCVKAPPTLTITPLSQGGSQGDERTYTVAVKNNDSTSCQIEAFYLMGTMPNGWTTVFDRDGTYESLPGNSTFGFTLNPQATSYVYFLVKPGTTVTDGTYTFPLRTYKNSEGADPSKYVTNTLSYVVFAPNTAPVARIVADKVTGAAPLTINFDGRSSSDAEGPISSYIWDFGDGTPTAMGATASHTYQHAGTYTVTLIVNDSGGKSHFATAQITVIADPLAGVNFSSGAVYELIGVGTSQPQLTITSGQASISVDLGTSLPGLSLTIASGGTVTFNSTQHISALELTGGRAVLTDGGNKTLNVSSLVISSGSLDLKDNDLIIDYTGSSPIGTWNGTTYTGIIGLVKSGRNGGSWNGSGIISSTANAWSSRTLGVAEAADVLGISGPTASWSGQAVDSTSVLVKFTYGGDANLSGIVNVDDYARIDANIERSGSVFGWPTGDFNYDGRINIDDYGIIDGSRNQTSTL